MRLVSWIVFVALAGAASLATAQPGPPPPTDDELRAATTPDALGDAAAQLVRLEQQINAASGAERVGLLHTRWRMVSRLAGAVSQARGRNNTHPDPAAQAGFERAVGHPAHHSAWALEACVRGAAEAHVHGDAARECLGNVEGRNPYYLQLAGWSRVFAEGSSAETHAAYNRAAACAARGETRCRIELSAMQIEMRDFAAAERTLRGMTDVGALTNLALATFLGGDRAGGFARLASVLAAHPDAVEAAFAYAHFTHFYVSPVSDEQARRALHAAALYLCHADPEADRRGYEFRVRGQAFQHTITFSGDWDRPVLPVARLPRHSWGPRRPEMTPRFTCAELDRTAASVFGAR